jgi:hypothetical protein
MHRGGVPEDDLLPRPSGIDYREAVKLASSTFIKLNLPG